MPSIAVIGPGAIGGSVATWLAQDPENRITVCARTPLDRLELETPYGRLAATPIVVTAPTEAVPVDWVIIATKAYDAAGAASWLGALRREDTKVAVLQNGVEHVERFAPYLPVEHIVPVIIDLPGERTAPGRLRQRGDAWLEAPDTEAGTAFVSLFRQTRIAARTTADWTTIAWKKLCINSQGAISAILLKPTGVVAIEPIPELMRGIVRECIAVGRAEGARLDDDLVEAVVNGCRTAPADGVNSLLADRRAGRPMEIDARNGAIVRFGRRHGIPTPLNEMAVALLTAAQDDRSF